MAALVKVIDETMPILDGDNNDLNDPSGRLQETASDGTVWTTIYPPFAKRTVWT